MLTAAHGWSGGQGLIVAHESAPGPVACVAALAGPHESTENTPAATNVRMRTSAAATASGTGIRLGWQLIAFGMQLTVDAPLVGRRYSLQGNAIRENAIAFHPGAVSVSRMDRSFPYSSK